MDLRVIVKYLVCSAVDLNGISSGGECIARCIPVIELARFSKHMPENALHYIVYCRRCEKRCQESFDE